MAPQIKGVGAFNPAANKKKHNQKVPQTRTPKEKRERIWGKTPQKPYVSSSLGDMARVMMRLMCMENTYFYNPEPPEVEYYDFWQKFSADLENVKDPEDFVDLNRISIANFKKNTSSFDFFGKFTAAIRDRHDMEAGGEQKEKKLTVEAQKLSDIWKDVRISMSSESFISSSTKISEPASVVQMETGWDEECSEDYQSSESDYGFDVQDKCRHHRHKYHWTAADDAHDEYKPSSLEFHTPQGLIEKQANAIAQSILALQKKDNKILYDLATQPRDMDLIDHFADDIDDSFLADSYSYSELPDHAFGPDFDFLNEDLIYKKGRKAKKGQQQVGAKTGSGETDDAIEDDEDEAADEDNKKGESGSSGSECENDSDNECQTKVKSKIPSKRPSQQVPRASSQRKTEDSEDIPEIGRYDACMRRRRRRIEDSLRAAVRRRSPMGSYRPKKGEEPLSKARMFCFSAYCE
ncbi:unnamed protein product [Orchesella dallaii]|uniref:Uncharacterized protein n=1 Tax=Orchesella dallaii TaxID=48710 RepID=A0ABP1PPV2_9HEXA